MHRYISMLRGINVSGRKKIHMEELKALYQSLAFKNVQTYIQSGNVIFASSESDISKLTAGIEKKIKQAFGFEVLVFIRTKEDLQKLIKKNPFAGEDEGKLYVTFLSDQPKNFPTEEINKIRDKAELFFHSSREIYLFCPNGYGRTKLSNTYFERKLKAPATTRNWKTVNMLFSMGEK